MHKLKITYDTGDSFHHEYGVTGEVDLKWTKLEKAKKALKDIEAHYKWYMIMNKEWNVDKNDQKKATRIAEKAGWYNRQYPQVSVLLEDDEGKRVNVSAFWCGYFETLVGVDVESSPEDGLSVRFR